VELYKGWEAAEVAARRMRWARLPAQLRALPPVIDENANTSRAAAPRRHAEMHELPPALGSMPPPPPNVPARAQPRARRAPGLRPRALLTAGRARARLWGAAA
jgi:hypothetical protein